MKKSFKIYLVTVNNEPIYSSLDEDDARDRFRYERDSREAGFLTKKKEVEVRELKIKVD